MFKKKIEFDFKKKIKSRNVLANNKFNDISIFSINNIFSSLVEVFTLSLRFTKQTHWFEENK